MNSEVIGFGIILELRKEFGILDQIRRIGLRTQTMSFDIYIEGVGLKD